MPTPEVDVEIPPLPQQSEETILLAEVNPDVSQRGMVIFTVAPGAHGFDFEEDDLDFWEDRTANVALGFWRTHYLQHHQRRDNSSRLPGSAQ